MRACVRASVGVRVWPCVGAPSVTDVHSAPCVTPSLSPEPHRCVVNPVPRLCSQCPGPLIPSRFCSVRCLHVPPSPPCDEMWELEGLLCTSKYREGRGPERGWPSVGGSRAPAGLCPGVRAPAGRPGVSAPGPGPPHWAAPGEVSRAATDACQFLHCVAVCLFMEKEKKKKTCSV